VPTLKLLYLQFCTENIYKNMLYDELFVAGREQHINIQLILKFG